MRSNDGLALIVMVCLAIVAAILFVFFGDLAMKGLGNILSWLHPAMR